MFHSVHYLDVPNIRKTNTLIMRKRILWCKSRNKKQIFKMQIIHYRTKNITIKGQMSLVIVFTISCVNKFFRCGVKYRGSDHGIFHNRYIFYVVVFDAIQRYPFHFLHPQNKKSLSLPYGSNLKRSYSSSNFLYIPCVVAFNIVVKTSSTLTMFRHQFDRTKIHPAN